MRGAQYRQQLCQLQHQHTRRFQIQTLNKAGTPRELPPLWGALPENYPLYGGGTPRELPFLWGGGHSLRVTFSMGALPESDLLYGACLTTTFYIDITFVGQTQTGKRLNLKTPRVILDDSTKKLSSRSSNNDNRWLFIINNIGLRPWQRKKPPKKIVQSFIFGSSHDRWICFQEELVLLK